MRSRLGRAPAALYLLPLLLVTMSGWSGCQLSRSFFQMDSDSRVPFFGVDLTPKWPQRGSATESVSRFQNEETHVSKSESTASSDKPPEPKRLTLPVGEASPTAAVADTGPVEQFR